MQQNKVALVLGATGNIGSALAARLVEIGWRVRALHRNPDALKQRDNRLEWRRGDAMRQEDVIAAAAGTELIVHAVNPPGYHNWGGLVLPMLDNSIAAARQSGARILLPGTVYNFGPDAFPLLKVDAPQRPLTRKGTIRVAMEQRLQEAASQGVRSLILRTGDFFGIGQVNNWFTGGMIKPGKPLSSMFYPGAPGVGHQWAYIPDVAETMLQLLNREEQLPTFARFHMGGHWDTDGTRMVTAVRRALNGRKLKVWALPWWALRVAALFSEMYRELLEMRYLWQQPVQLDNSSLLQLLGEEPHTPWDQAVKTTLESLGCVSLSGASEGATDEAIADSGFRRL